ANALGRIGGAAAGYVLHGRITFAGDHEHRRAGPRYLLLFLANLAGSSLLLELAVGRMGLPPLLARIGVDIVVIATSFTVARFWVFAKQ
ncbi:MAG: GtrA family protein, partial [Novosphingobium sp.]